MVGFILALARLIGLFVFWNVSFLKAAVDHAVLSKQLVIFVFDGSHQAVSEISEQHT